MSEASFKIVAWGSERPFMTFVADTANEAFELALNKAVYASLEVRIFKPGGEEITFDQLAQLARQEIGQ